MSKKQNRATTQARDGQVIAGIKKDLQNVPQLLLNGETYTPASLMALLQSRIDATNGVAVDKANYEASSKAYRALNTKCTSVVSALKQYVMNAYGKDGTQLADFGFTPPKKAALTPEQKAAAVAKRAATRKARNTQGPKAKLSVTGETAKLAALQAAALPEAPTAAPAPAPVPAAAPAPAATPPKA
jgi:hypothetical protein